MTSRPTPAEQLDRAVTGLLADDMAPSVTRLDPSLRPLVEAAAALRSALAPMPVSGEFEARLGMRLANAGLIDRMRALRGSGRLLVTGAAVSSAAVGVGVTAYAVWRSTRRSAMRRVLHR